MSKTITAVGLMVLVLLFSACSTEGSVGQGEGAALGDSSAEQPLALDMQLVVGSFLLEDSALAIDREQASALLPYWQMYLLLNESDDAAQEELDAILAQIQEMMDPQQISYIDDLQLVQGSVTSIVEDLGPGVGVKSVEEDSLSVMDGNSQGRMPDDMAAISGGNPEAGFGEDMQVSDQSGQQADDAGANLGSQSYGQLVTLINALISQLESISAS